MSRQLAVWKLIGKSLQEKIPVMLLYVLDSQGSSPGRQGFAMSVNASGEMAGSIGGGIMEHKFVEMAKEKLAQDEDEHSVRKQVHDKAAAKNQSGMICSGEQTIFIYRVHASELHDVLKLIKCLEENRSGMLELSANGISFSDEVPGFEYEYAYQSEEQWVYKEKIGSKNHLYIIGGGHCALALSKIIGMMDFYIHLYDDRPYLNTFHENEFVHEKQIVGDYNELEKLVPDGENVYVVVMTFGYRTDDIAVRALMEKKVKYFGLLGSKKKIEKMYSDYIGEGIDESLLQRIHAPVGLDIKSETPEEIAVSIAGEIVKVKNKG